MKNKYRYMIAAWILASIGLNAVLNFAQVPAPDPAVDNLIMWGEIKVDTTDFDIIARVDTTGKTIVYPYAKLNIYGMVELWRIYKAECYADSTYERVHKSGGWQEIGACWGYSGGVGCQNKDHYEWIWIHKDPYQQSMQFFDWLEGRVKPCGK